MLIYGAAECGVISILDDLSMPMLTDIISYKTKISGGGKEGAEPKSLSELAKGGKL